MLNRFKRISSLRYKLLALVLVPLLLLSGTVIFLAAQWSTDYTYRQLFTKVNTDLQVAHDAFNRTQLDRERDLASLADSLAFRDALTARNLEELDALLAFERELGGFDFLNLWSADGQRKLQPSGWEPAQLRSSPMTDRLLNPDGGNAARDTDAAAGIEIYQRDDWFRESAALQNTVLLPLVDTPRAVPTDRATEDRAMVIRALRRVRDRTGVVQAVLEGGLLLNRNFRFVDEIRDLVYGPGSLAEGSRGTVTVFLDDVRITTNVPGRDESRALGTRVSREVRHTVLEQGVPWIDRAFVVNDWYISAYEPIVDVAGKRVGMLYAGYLEAPFRADLNRALTLLTALVLAGSLLAAVAAVLGAKSIFQPIETIAMVARATSAGERRRIGAMPSGDEVGELAAQFDAMLDTLEEHRARIEQGAAQLEQTVERRTAELQQKNQSLQESITLLQKTREQLALAEKLAALGELTAGVAHEINNPTAVILGNMDVLIDQLGSMREPVQTEIDLIIEQVYRIRSITDRLLQYSRPATDEGVVPPIDLHHPSHFSAGSTADVGDVIGESILFAEHEAGNRRIEFHHHSTGVDAARIDRQELQQVIVNLLVNAMDAVGDVGQIHVRAENQHDDICITVTDDGVGIPREHLQRVFDPFFTSGKERGTGLGLSVSYGIVRRYGGSIAVESTMGEGSRFRVLLPVADQHRNRSDSGLSRIQMSDNVSATELG